jgi:pyruvate/2-oxoglutarate dehydrogenase complex dihydrolipoamide acyltransferase (E2) component
MMREPIRFETNVPVVASLRFNDGKDVQGRYGDQVLYTVQTADGERVMYVPPIVRTKIEQAGLTAGDWFRIGKFEVRNGQRKHLEWKVERLQPEEQAPKLGKPAPAPQKSAHVGAHPQPTTPPPAAANGTPAPPPPAAQPAPPAAPAPAAPEPTSAPRPQTKLEDALKTVVAACHAATLYAKEIGFAIPNFTSEDISKMAMTLTIEARNGGAR